MIRLMSIVAAVFISIFALAEDAEHKHDEKEPANHEAHNHAEGEEAEHKHEEGEEGHGHEEEAGNVGPEKGIIEVSEKSGFKLSPEALKNFDLSFQKLQGDGPWALPRSAIVHSGEEVNVFRRRKDFFKRIDFETLKKNGSELTVDSDDLREGDEVVLTGLGFLRIAELASSGGIAHGHSH